MDSKFSNTFLLIKEDNVVGFFSLQTDAIKLKQEEEQAQTGCHLLEYPAAKIGRLAVDNNCQSKGLGRLIIKIAVGLIRQVGRYAAVRFITVDSYREKIGFYDHLGFALNQHTKYTGKDDYVSMRFDLYNPKEQ
jgi:GNAT superfamily N-acetyltransferase